MGDWLGTGNLATHLRKYREFCKARAFVRKLKLKSLTHWIAFCKGKMARLGGLPLDIPASPNKVYADKGWMGYGDWLGTGRIADQLKEFRPFPQARAFARSLNLRSSNEWKAFCRGEMPQRGRLPPDISAWPNQVYANKGWKSIEDWLEDGTTSLRLRYYRPFPAAREFARNLKLKSVNEWFAYCKGELPRLRSNRLPGDIPRAPNRVYAAGVWINWGDWLGTGAVSTGLRKSTPRNPRNKPPAPAPTHLHSQRHPGFVK